MARPRQQAESAYRRRLRRYLETHPGASTQAARGHKPRPGAKPGAEYRARIRKARKRYPGISQRAAAGRGTQDEKTAMRLIRLIPRLRPDASIMFTGVDRTPDGLWRTARFDILTDQVTDGELTFKVGPSGHSLLPAVAQTIALSGWATLGAKYMTELVRNGIPAIDGIPVVNHRGDVFADGSKVGRGPKDWRRLRAEGPWVR